MRSKNKCHCFFLHVKKKRRDVKAAKESKLWFFWIPHWHEHAQPGTGSARQWKRRCRASGFTVLTSIPNILKISQATRQSRAWCCGLLHVFLSRKKQIGREILWRLHHTFGNQMKSSAFIVTYLYCALVAKNLFVHQKLLIFSSWRLKSTASVSEW